MFERFARSQGLVLFPNRYLGKLREIKYSQTGLRERLLEAVRKSNGTIEATHNQEYPGGRPRRCRGEGRAVLRNIRLQTSGLLETLFESSKKFEMANYLELFTNASASQLCSCGESSIRCPLFKATKQLKRDIAFTAELANGIQLMDFKAAIEETKKEW